MNASPITMSTAAATALLLTAMVFTPVVSSGTEPPAPESPPKLALVLSGGGARGIAHVGVLKVLEELNVVPDLVIGTSMGAVVGGLYCAGWSPTELEKLVKELDWSTIFDDRVTRRERSFRRKQDDRPVMIQARIHFNGFKPVLPSGVIRAEKLNLILNALEAWSVPSTDFDRLPIPFRAVAADLATGEPVVLDSGSLATAIRASMSIPGAFPPVPYGGRELVDGGIAANLPVGIARDLGAEAIIAVDISSPLLHEGQELGSFLAIYNHLNSLLTASNVDRDVALLDENDLFIRPDLGNISFVEFDRAPELVTLGEKATRSHAAALRRFAVEERQWAVFADRPRAQLDQPIQIDSVHLENESSIDDRIVRSALSIDPPETLDAEKLGQELLELYNSRYFGSIGFMIDQSPEGNTLVVETPPPPHGRGSLQFGIGFLDDFRGGSGYLLLARHQFLPANRRGGEWQNMIQLGTDSLVATEFYQPLDAGMRWFVEPSAGFGRSLFEFWDDGQPVAEYVIDTARLNLAAGRVLGKWGEIRLTAFTSEVSGSPRIGDPSFPSDQEIRGGGELEFRIDTVDEVAFPNSGSEVRARYTQSSDALGAESDFKHVWVAAEHAWSTGKYTLVPYLEYGENLLTSNNVLDLFGLGGIGRLSGLGTDELLGEKVALARLLTYRRLWRMEVAGLRVRFLAGLSLEAGNTYSRQETVALDSLLTGGAVFVGADTPLGPAYFAWGFTEGGRDRFYFAIGDHF